MIFANCSNLESVTFGSGIQKIGTGGGATFNTCTKLSSVTIPSDASLAIIYEKAFGGCNIKRIELPSSLLMIGANAFGGSVEELVLGDENATWYYIEGDEYYSSQDFTNLVTSYNANNYNPSEVLTTQHLITEISGTEAYTSNSEKLLYAIKQHPLYFFYCVI